MGLSFSTYVENFGLARQSSCPNLEFTFKMHASQELYGRKQVKLRLTKTSRGKNALFENQNSIFKDFKKFDSNFFVNIFKTCFELVMNWF